MIVLAMAHSTSWFLTQTCLQSLRACPPEIPGENVQVVIVDNSWDFSPSIMGITETELGEGVTVINNPLRVRSHGGALDLAFERLKPDFLAICETDVTATRPGWLQAFWAMMQPSDFVVGGWHLVEQYIAPCVAIFRGRVLSEVVEWSGKNPTRELRWGMTFEKVGMMTDDEWDGRTTPFGERRGWPAGTVLKVPSRCQDVGPGWYEPGHVLFHWGVNAGYTYSVMPSVTERGGHDGTIPVGTFYGDRNCAWCVHWSCGTRGLTTMFVPDGNQDWVDPWIGLNREWLLRREATQWLQSVPKAVQDKTLDLIRKHGWRIGNVTEGNRRAIVEAERIYREAGIPL